MDKYKISQTPTKLSPKIIKNFWVSKGQRKTLNKKTIITSVIVAVIIIIAGIGFAILRLKNKPATPSGALPVHGATVKETTPPSRIYTVPPATFNAVTNAVTNKNASLLGAYFASQVHVIIPGSFINEVISSNDAANLINNGLAGAASPWNFHVPASELSQWQSGPDGQYFNGIDIVGISSNGDVISIGFNNTGQIDSVFIAPVSSLGSSGSTSGSATTTPSPSTQTAPQPVNAAD